MCRNLDEEVKFQNAVESGILCNKKYCSVFTDFHSPNELCEDKYCEKAWEVFCKNNEESSETILNFFKERTL